MKRIITCGVTISAGLMGGMAAADRDLSLTHTRDNAASGVGKDGAAPTDFSGMVAGAPGAECVYDNHNPLSDFGSPASQRDSVYPFYAEAADDFMLPGDPTNGCVLSQVMFAATWFGVPAGVTPSPEICWSGVSITIYEDAELFCGPGFIKGPAGVPLDAPPQGHSELCPGGVVCEISAHMTNVSGTLLAVECTGAINYEILVSNLQVEGCVLEKNHKYWIAIAPQQLFAVCGQNGLMLSNNETQIGQPSQQTFPLLGLPWTVIGGNGGNCPPKTPPKGSRRDLSIGIAAIKEAPCEWDLANDDGVVDARDLATLLGNWGNPYGSVELAGLLAAWGPC